MHDHICSCQCTDEKGYQLRETLPCPFGVFKKIFECLLCTVELSGKFCNWYLHFCYHRQTAVGWNLHLLLHIQGCLVPHTLWFFLFCKKDNIVRSDLLFLRHGGCIFHSLELLLGWFYEDRHWGHGFVTWVLCGEFVGLCCHSNICIWVYRVWQDEFSVYFWMSPGLSTPQYRLVGYSKRWWKRAERIYIDVWWASDWFEFIFIS